MMYYDEVMARAEQLADRMLSGGDLGSDPLALLFDELDDLGLDPAEAWAEEVWAALDRRAQ